jgi:hypothetical protein
MYTYMESAKKPELRVTVSIRTGSSGYSYQKPHPYVTQEIGERCDSARSVPPLLVIGDGRD